jgi:4-hydroxybenzoate polyprenyltransferase
MVYHWFLIRGRSREGSFKAFMHNNWVGGAVFAGIVLGFPFGGPR